ncbi:MAG: diacylglycerol kinase, partial [Patescibacteria group bacterium]|nr:diacylglycerol kinase [Patescibacteria group bacterium]
MHIVRALDYGFRGVRIAFREEKIFKIELFGAILAILLGIYFRFTLLEYCILVLA